MLSSIDIDIAVLVPVTRPHCAKPFMASVKAPVYAMVNDDCLEPWRTAGATIINGPETTWSQRLNRLFRETTEEWVLCVGEDVVFHDGWIEALEPYLDYKVIGTNDLLFATSEYLPWENIEYTGHSPHPVVNRQFVIDHGLTFDGGPGTLFHEYQHLFADTELMQVAHHSGVWAYAEECIIEHVGDRDKDYSQTFTFSRVDTKAYTRRYLRYKRKLMRSGKLNMV